MDRPDAAIYRGVRKLTRARASGFEQSMVISIDHHPGNDNFGQIQLVQRTRLPPRGEMMCLS